MQTGEALVAEEIAQTFDGTLSTFLTTKTPWRDGDGNIVGVVGVSHNITERKKMEEALRESEQKALSLVAKLEEADKNKNEFLNALSHELRNPLATIVAGFSLLDLTEDKQKIAQTKGIMQRQINQLCHLVDDLLDITRITNNKIELKKERIDINELVSSIGGRSHKTFSKIKG
jgi:signal transduction histidine kinase